MAFKVLDIEVFPNVFIAVIKDIESGETKIIEKSERKNNTYLLKKELYGNYVITYNGIFYDDPVINFVIRYPNATCKEIKKFSDYIINSEDVDINYRNNVKPFKYSKKYTEIDLMTMLFSKKLRVGLKHIQVMLKWHDVLECDLSFDEDVPENELDNMIAYCKNDVESTEYLYKYCYDKIDFRMKIEKEYGIYCLSKDDVSLGVDLLLKMYCDYTKKSKWDVKDLRTHNNIIKVKDIISPKIEFKSKEFQDIYEHFNKIVLTDSNNEINYDFIYLGEGYTYGKGGLHSKDRAFAIIKNEDEYLIDCDVASLYPSILINEKFYPKHLNEDFIHVYQDVKNKRIEAKKNKDFLTSDSLKLSLNGLIIIV